MDETKRRLVQSWLKKALHDLAAARSLAEPDRPILDVAIYHCQQAAEKALKGYPGLLGSAGCEDSRHRIAARASR